MGLWVAGFVGLWVCGLLCVCVVLWFCVFLAGFVGLWVVARERSFLRGILARRFSRLSGFVGVSVCGFVGLRAFVCVRLWDLCVDGFVGLWVYRFVGFGLRNKFFSWHSDARERERERY